MKNKLLVIAIASLTLAGCAYCVPVERQPNLISCDVDPDEMFGAHYTAADFQIWSMADNGMARIVSGKARKS